MDLADSPGGFMPRLFLCGVRFRQHNSPRLGDVHPVSGCNGRGRRSGRAYSITARISFELKCRINALRDDARARLFWIGLCYAAAMVDGGIGRVADQFVDLVDRRPRMVEAAWLVVAKVGEKESPPKNFRRAFYL